MMEKIQKAAAGAGKIAAGMDSSALKGMSKDDMKNEIMAYVAAAVKTIVFGENQDCSMYYKNGTFKTRGLGYGNNIEVKLPLTEKMMLEGAVSRKCDEAAQESSLEKAEIMTDKMAAYIRSLPAEPYMNVTFTNGWIAAAAQEYILEQWAAEHGEKVDDNLHICPVSDINVSYNALYGMEFHPYDMYITKDGIEGTSVLEHYPINESMREKVTQAIMEKAEQVQQMMKEKPENVMDYQQKAASVMQSLPQKALDALDDAKNFEMWMDKRELDLFIKDFVSETFAGFMAKTLPYAGHFMKTNEIMPEVNFNFGYATSPEPLKPEDFFVRFCNERAAFTKEQAKEFEEKSAEIIKVARYMEHYNKSVENTAEKMQQCIKSITKEDLDAHGFENTLENKMTDLWQAEDEIYNLPENKTTVSMLYSQDGNGLLGVMISGTYTGEMQAVFTEDECNKITMAAYDLFNEIGLDDTEEEFIEKTEEIEESL